MVEIIDTAKVFEPEQEPLQGCAKILTFTRTGLAAETRLIPGTALCVTTEGRHIIFKQKLAHSRLIEYEDSMYLSHPTDGFIEVEFFAVLDLETGSLIARDFRTGENLISSDNTIGRTVSTPPTAQSGFARQYIGHWGKTFDEIKMIQDSLMQRAQYHKRRN